MKKIIALIDSSEFNDGKAGMVFSNNRIFWKRIMGNSDSLSYSEVSDFFANQKLLKDNIPKYNELSEKIHDVSDLFYFDGEDVDNEKLRLVLQEISQKYQRSIT